MKGGEKMILRKRVIKYLILTIICFSSLFTIKLDSAPLLKAQGSMKFVKEWETTNISTTYQPIKIMKVPNQNIFCISYFDKLIFLNALDGRILREYLPEKGKLILDFLVDSSSLYISMTSKDLACRANSVLEKINTTDNTSIWRRELPFGFYFLLYTSSDDLLISGTHYYRISKINGEILKDYFCFFANAEMDILLNSCFSINGEVMYWFVSDWYDIFRFNLPNLTLMKEKTHIEERIKDIPLYLFGINESNDYILLSERSILIVTNEGKIKKEIDDLLIDYSSIRHDYSVNTEVNKYFNPSIYRNYIFIRNDSHIQLIDSETGKVYKREIDSLNGGAMHPQVVYPAFFENKLFLLDIFKFKQTARITIMDIPNLELLASQTEKIQEFREPSINGISFMPYFPFIFIESGELLKLMVVYPTKICLYEVGLKD